ncbi:Pyrophosphate-energized proton pump 2 [Bienertia sinuspersici]
MKNLEDHCFIGSLKLLKILLQNLYFCGLMETEIGGYLEFWTDYYLGLDVHILLWGRQKKLDHFTSKKMAKPFI